MAITAGKQAARRFGRETYDPDRLSSPQVFLLSMVIFLAIAAFVGAILYRQVSKAFSANPGLNGLIVGVLIIGIILAILQVMRLFREVSWVNGLRAGDPDTGTDPVLLAPMKALVGRRQSFAMSTMTMRSILDSIATRLDESRDISRYLTGLLVFLGLLGTFWGLLQTISSIGDTIQALDPQGGDANSMLDSLKSGLSAPLAGMATAFSSSLLGLSGSLILGFLDLQAGRAQNRFYTELENWLSSVTDTDHVSVMTQPSLPYPAQSDEIRQLVDRLKMATDGTGGSNQKTVAAMASLAEGIQGLVKNMRSEQQMMRDWVEQQANEQKATRVALEKIAKSMPDRKG
ncbi:MAG: MotA/TolQ/ExbB proton channel family protein [Rhizobiaceae bacterium]